MAARPSTTDVQGHSGGAPSSCEQRPESTSTPRSSARVASSCNRRDLPTPASPTTEAAPATPSAAAASRASSAASSPSRPTRGQLGSGRAPRPGPVRGGGGGGGNARPVRRPRLLAGCRDRPGRRPEELGGLRQHGRLDRAQARPGVDAELLDEQGPDPAQGLESGALLPRAGQRDREHRPHRLPQGVGPGEGLGVGSDRGRVTEAEPQHREVLGCDQPQLLEPAALRTDVGGVGEVGVRRSADETQGALEPGRQGRHLAAGKPRRRQRQGVGGTGQAAVHLRHGGGEPAGVDVLGPATQAVSVVGGEDDVRPQQAAQPVDIGLQRGAGRGRRALAPEQLDELVHAHGPPGVECERGKQSALLRRPGVRRSAVQPDAGLAQHQHVHARHVHDGDCTSLCSQGAVLRSGPGSPTREVRLAVPPLPSPASRPTQMPTGSGDVVVCDNLVRIYQTGTSAAGSVEVQALQGLDLLVAEGEFVAIVGASGSGKSTLLSILAGVDAPTAGRAHVDGWDLLAMTRRQRVAYRRHVVGLVRQQAARNLVPYLTAAQVVDLPLTIAGAGRRQRRARVAELLEAVGVPHCADRRPEQMSGGEQQRVAICVALANAPRVLLADEPTGELDGESSAEVFGALRTVNREFGTTVVVVTHDSEVSGRVTRTVAIRDGRTSSEVLRSDGQLDGEGPGEEYAVMDRAGRVQVPREYREALALANRVRLTLEADHVALRPDGLPR